jgi:hypothetical protein
MAMNGVANLNGDAARSPALEVHLHGDAPVHEISIDDLCADDPFGMDGAEWADIKPRPPDRADVAVKLRESDRKLQIFWGDSKQALQQLFSDVGERHQQFLSDISLLYKNLQEDIKGLSDLKSDLARFVCPSALAIVEPDITENGLSPEASALPLQPPSTLKAPLPDPSSLEEASGGQPTADAATRATSGDIDFPHRTVDGTLTEAAFKDHLFLAMAPLYTVRDQFKGAVVPLQEAIKKLNTDITDLKYQQTGLRTASSLQDPEHRPLRENSQNSMEDDKMKSYGYLETYITDTVGFNSYSQTEALGDTKPTKGGSLIRATSNLNFAADILGEDQVSEKLLEQMATYRMPGREMRRQLINTVAEPERTSPLAKFILSLWFERIVSVVIILNIAFITYSTDYAAANPHAQMNFFIRTTEGSFQVCYIFELALKLTVHRLYFFVGKEWYWNWLDFLLAATAAYDLTATLASSNWEDNAENFFSLTFLRVLRLARLSKVMRVFRVVRFVSELHTLLKAIYSSLQPLCWCMAMLAVFFYIFAVVFVQATVGYLIDPDADKTNEEDILKNWGSVARAFISLYKATTGGADWGDVSDTLSDVGRVYYCLFLFFIAFIILALLNILTGIFVDRAMKASAEDKDGEALTRLNEERDAVADLCRLHCVISKSEVEDKARITRQQFEDNMASPAMRARFAVLGLEIWDSKQFFEMLTALAESEDVDLRSFVAGCMQMRGPSQRLGLQTVAHKLNMLTKVVKQRLPPPRVPRGSRSDFPKQSS